MAKIRIIKKNNDCSMEYEVGDIFEIAGTWYGGVHINGRSGIPVSLDKEEYMELNTEPEINETEESENRNADTPKRDIQVGRHCTAFQKRMGIPGNFRISLQSTGSCLSHRKW